MPHPLLTGFGSGLLEAGCDEAGRGCLAGPVFAAAVILPGTLDGELPLLLNDSKKLRPLTRQMLSTEIRRQALAYGVAMISHEEIDRTNILQASIRAMHLALELLNPQPGLILVDGNRFSPYGMIPYHCIIRGDGRYMSIAAASVLAKTARDEYMRELHRQFPLYGWDRNKGYPTMTHRNALKNYGLSPFHRKTFNLRLGKIN